MNVISYRGPGMSGGVSSGLSRVWEDHKPRCGSWNFFENNSFKALTASSDFVFNLIGLPEACVQGHYRYSNEFIWPVMHDLSQYAKYDAIDHGFYRKFNKVFAEILEGGNSVFSQNFIQDYQLALLPQALCKSRNKTFWHIPWPINVDPAYSFAVQELALGLLHGNSIGFHTKEYAENFINFVEKNLPNYVVDKSNMLIGKLDADGSIKYSTKLIVAPLGIDSEFWKSILPMQAGESKIISNIPTQNYVLSVDRVDYVKGVLERIQTVDRFFERRTDQIGKLSFIQVSGRTRTGLTAYDSYWAECKKQYEYVNARWKSGSWQPIVWIEESLCERELAVLYRNASALFVNAIRDGLNLTAKEYVACQTGDPGALLLSSGTGVWHELGSHAVTLDPTDIGQMTEVLSQALDMSFGERLARMELMRYALRSNSLTKWWNQFASEETDHQYNLSDLSRELASTA